MSAPVIPSVTPSLSDLLDTVDELSARRPVAARLVAMTDDDRVGSRDLAAVIVGDVVLTTRVMRLANSAYFGLGGRVRTVAFAVTVVGFSTVRSMAAVAAAGIDTAEQLPDDFWERSKATAVACGAVAGSFALPSPDAFCLGLLASLGQAVLLQHDPAGYGQLLAREDVRAGGRAALLAAEVEEYGFGHTQISAAALSAWSFPHDLAQALHALDSADGAGSPWVLCLRTGLEVAARLTTPEQPPGDIALLSGGAVGEERLATVVPRVAAALVESDW